MIQIKPSHVAILVPLVIAVVGCKKASKGPDPAFVAAERAKLLLAEEPTNAVDVLALRTALLEDAAEDGPIGPKETVVVGKLGGVANPWKSAEPHYPWSKGKAQFFIADIPASQEASEHSHAHQQEDGHDCPFCAGSQPINVVALVRFLGENGQPLRIDARELFDLTGDETVVVRGSATASGRSDKDVLILDADGCYVRTTSR